MSNFRLTFILFLITLSLHTSAQTNTLLSQCYGGNNNDAIYKILPTSDSGFIFAGHTWSTNQQVNGQHGARDMWIVKCDTGGQIIWQRCLGGSDEEGATCMFAEGNSFVIGGFASSVDGNVTGLIGAEDFWLIKLRDDNTMQWKKCFGGSFVEQMYDVIPSSDGGYLMAGFTFSNDGDVTGLHGPPDTWADAWVVKTDAQRNIIWQKCLGGTEADAAYRIKELPGGNIILAASTNSTNGDITLSRGNRDIWMVKLDAQGNLLQQKNFGGSFDEAPSDMILTTDHQLLITGYSFSDDGDLTGNYFNGTTNWEDAWVLQIDTSFNLQWQKNLGGTHSDIGNSLMETPNGYLLAAESASTNFDRSQSFGFKDYWLVQLDSIGNIVWEQSFGGNSFDFPKTMSADLTGKLMLGGFTSSTNLCALGNTDIWVVKVDTALTATWGIEVEKTEVEVIASPVPFSTHLTVDLTGFSNVQRLEVLDLFGRCLYSTATVVNTTLTLSTSTWGSGIYFVRLTKNDKRLLKKVVKR